MKNNRLKLSIVIPCATDIRLVKCIKSIDENVEIIVVLNGATKEVKKLVKDLDIIKVTTSKANLANALNLGIGKAKYEKIIFIDPDCVFQKGAIKKVFEALNDNLVVKGKVVFEYNSFQSKIVAETRDYVNYNKPKPYNPFLAIRKSIKKFSGGYYFSSDIFWTEDADFYSRYKNNVHVKFLFSAKAFHPPLSFPQDLKSAFKYGIGKRIRVEKEKSRGIGTHFLNIPNLINNKGMLCGFYYFVWNISYIFGYLSQIIFDPYNQK